MSPGERVYEALERYGCQPRGAGGKLAVHCPSGCPQDAVLDALVGAPA